MELSGCIVTIDAMGCQKEIVKLIAEPNADYIITLKNNQGSLYKNVENLFKEAIRTGFKGFEHSTYHTREQAHGREEIRHEEVRFFARKSLFHRLGGEILKFTY